MSRPLATLGALAALLAIGAQATFSGATFSSQRTNPATLAKAGTWATAPTAVDVQGTGTDGALSLTDTLRFTFSEAMAPSSLAANWTGTPARTTTVTVTDRENVESVTFGAANLGSVALGSGADYVRRNNAVAFTTATLALSADGKVATVTFNALPANPQTAPNASPAATMVWSPSTQARSATGAAMAATTATESGASDRDF